MRADRLAGGRCPPAIDDGQTEGEDRTGRVRAVQGAQCPPGGRGVGDDDGRQRLAEGRLDAETRGRVDAVLRSMWRNRYIDADRLRQAMRAPLDLKIR